MAITRNVGTAAASIAANTTALQAAIDLGTVGGVTTIVLGAGAQFKAIGFRNNITTDSMTLISANRNNPAIMTEGFRLSGGDDEAWYRSLTGPQASDVRNITFDGIHFEPRHILVVTPSVGDGAQGGTDGNYTIRDAKPLSWRIDPTFDGFNGPGGSRQGYTDGEAMMKAFTGFGGTRNIIVQNCFFRGYGQGFDISGCNGFRFRHNTWVEWHEDCLFMGGGSNITIEYNEWLESKSISYRDAHYGWGYGTQPVPPGQNPPHPDANQTYRHTSNLLFQFNVMYDDGESHFFLHKLNKDNNTVANYHTGTIIQNNYSRQNGGTTIWVSATNGAIVQRNKMRGNGGGTSVIMRMYLNNPGLVYLDNVAPSLFDGAHGSNPDPTVDDLWEPAPPGGRRNVEANNDATMPAGWIEMRRGMTAPGVPFAGQYGGIGEVVPTNPAGLTSGQVAFEALVQDPAFLDARRTFTIAIPKRIIRFSNGSVTVAAGATINGQTSGATAVTIAEAVVESGTYGGGNAAGYIHIGSVTGTWSVGENIRITTAVKSQVSVVPNDSPASSADLMRWSSDAGPNINDMIQLADSGMSQIWRALPTNAGGTGHLRSPTFTFTNVKLYYRLTSTSLLSDPSTYTFTETVPDVGNPDPIADDTIYVDHTRRVSLTDGDAFRLVTKEEGLIWQMPG